ncbi:hypothetical protein EC973_004002 [Apophysomyces ossiformis]|uniref:Uncharacterized protein n=1 Tax=Apophysomyces ossiformis TaxID=679940 RepID=A0A8H7EUX7_9FUNG|nr:hypothetical protein EC973_004002 [Apophysomyces ossiformis]
MGAQQSKSSEPVIFYNQNVPLQTASSSEASNVRPEEVENIVRQRVTEELQRAQEQQEELNKQIYGDIAKRNIDHDHNSVAMGADIESMIQRIQRSPAKEIPADVAERQEAVILCYKKNESRPLDCWEEVEQFKESVAKAQKKFVAAYQ